MKLAIHNGISWNIKWIEYCKKNKIPVEVVNCYDTNIINLLKQKGITHLMWHFSHNFPKDILMARNVLFSAAKMGIKTFPDFDTCWHYDDKISQKYILEAVDTPLVPSYAFYNKKEAIDWLKNEARYSLVAKLRRGAGSYNVRLLKNYSQARKYTCKMFGKGTHSTPGYLADVKTKYKVAGNLKGIIKRLKKAPNFFRVMYAGKKALPKEKGYVYFQDFVPDNMYDVRIAIVGNHIWGFKRKVRDNDFRASGSGMLDYSLEDIPLKIIKDLFLISKRLNTQSVAYDLVKDKLNHYYIVEISYCYMGEVIYNSPGYWDENLNFVKGHFIPEHIILENFIR